MVKRNTYLISVFLLHVVTCFSQVNQYGIPFIHNYGKEAYKASEQNWAVLQDKRGVMYFGNTDGGVIEYDGVTWRRITVINSTVRSLAIDDEGKIYIGGTAEFGYIQPDRSGKLSYISLTGKVDSINRTNSDIYKTNFYDGCIYFNAFEKLYKFKKDSLVWIKELDPSVFFFSFVVNNHFYIGHNADGIYELIGDSLVYLAGSDFFAGKLIFSMLSCKDKILVGTYKEGIFLYNPETGNVTKLDKTEDINKFLVNAQIYDGIKITDDTYAIGTLQKGCFILSVDGGIEYLINEEAGLQNQIITSHFINLDLKSPSPVLWTTLSMGISTVDILNPVKRFGKESGIKGGINDVIRFNNELYIATDFGVFYLSGNENGLPQFRSVKNINYQSWSFQNFHTKSKENILLVATQGGIYEINADKTAESVETKLLIRTPSRYQSKIIVQSKVNPSILYVGHNRGFTEIDYRDNRWYQSKEASFNNQVKGILEEPDGDIWLTTEVDGIFRLKPGKSQEDKMIIIYDDKKGIPLNEANEELFVFKGSIVVGSNKGFFYYNEKSDSFQSYSEINNYLEDSNVNIYKHKTDGTGNHLLSINKQGIWEVKIINEDLKKDVESINHFFKVLPNNSAEAFYFDENNRIWIAISDELFCLKIDSYRVKDVLNEDKNNIDSSTYNCLIRKVTIAEDSVLFYGTYYDIDEKGEIGNVSLSQPENLKYTLPFKYNSISFEFAAPYFIQENMTVYSHKLEGFDKEWSKWSNETKAIYTNLNEGHYMFKVKAKNIYNVESTIASYEFTILPPWYRTIIAFIVYVVAAAFLVFIIVKLYTKRLKRENERLECIVADRTAEVVKQKDEIEKQRDKIAAQNKDITDSIHYASRIQRALLPSEKLLKDNFPEHFVLFRPRDIVSGDFYWMTRNNGKSFIVAADCTGHGVPGAFMSMLGISFLNEIINKSGIYKPDKILYELRTHVVDALKQEGKIGEQKDGMDLAMIVIDKLNKTLEFSGANNSMYWIRPLTDEEKKEIEKGAIELPRGIDRNNKYELQQVNADKMPIGISVSMDKTFTSSKVHLTEGHTFYLFSDGFVDQFGGSKGKKFMSKGFKDLLLEIQQHPMQRQKELLIEAIEDWMKIGETNQVDDILVIGIKVDKLS